MNPIIVLASFTILEIKIPRLFFIAQVGNESEKESQMSYFYMIIVFGFVLAYGIYFYHRSQAQKAGGDEAHSRARLNKLFRLPEGESVTAAWDAITVPKLSKGQKTAEAVSAVTAAVGLVGIQYVGRPLWVACTTQNRVLIFDKEDKVGQAYDPRRRPRFVDTGKEGTKRTSPTKWGWVAGAIVSLEIPGNEPLEIDIRADAVQVLVGWSGGQDASRLTGPLPPSMTV
jgi:hypothetical protein